MEGKIEKQNQSPIVDNDKILSPPPMTKRKDLILNAPKDVPGEIKVDKQGRLLKKWFEEYGRVGSLIETYNNWVTTQIGYQLESYPIQVNTNKGLANVRLVNHKFLKPRIPVSGNKWVPLTPRIAREGDRTYSSELYVTLKMSYENPNHKPEYKHNVYLGNIPTMIRSVLCNTTTMSEKELFEAGECIGDVGGGFIIKGTEKLIMIQEKLRVNRIFIYNPTTKSNPICKITNETVSGSSVVNLVQDSSTGSIELKLGFMGNGDGKSEYGNTIPVFSAFRMFGITNPDDMFKYVSLFIKPKWIRLVWVKLMPSFIQIQNIGDDFEYLSKKMGKKNVKDIKQTIIDGMLRDLFPQIPKEDVTRKFYMLSLMIARYAEHLSGLREIDDRDNWGNKRLETAGRSMEQLFGAIFKRMTSKIQEDLSNTPNVTLSLIQTKIDSSIITDNFVSAFGANKWGVKGPYLKKENITDVLKPDNLMARFAQLTKINTPTSRRSKSTNIRLVQMSQLGYICPVETPEGEHCGVVKNSAITNWISIASNDLIISQYLSDGDISLNKLKEKSDIFWLNGKFIGWCDGQNLHKKFINLRRSNKIPFSTCIVFDKDDQILYIYTDSSRPTRPLLVVSENGKLVIDEKNLWESDFNTLMSEGAVEYIDAFEQEHIMLAYSVTELENQNAENQEAINYTQEQIERLSNVMDDEGFISGDTSILTELNLTIDQIHDALSRAQNTVKRTAKKKKYTHCEMDPTAILGLSASMIPMLNHNQAPRNTYQCSMGRQALGIYHSNYSTRFDTTAKCLAYPSRPLFETQMSEILGVDEIPSGQTAMVAIMTKTGYNQEDAIIFNQGSIDRGLFMMVVYKTYKSIAKNNNDIIETFERPPLRSEEDQKRYHALAPNGIAIVGSMVKEGDILVSKKRTVSFDRNAKVEYDYLKVGVGVEGIVDKVLYTNNHEDNRVVYVKLRQVRKPIIGDKFASRQAQKATIGMILPEVDMPYIMDGPNKGMRPDIIINPHCIPSRMTIGMLIEIVASKLAALRGERINATAFRSFDVQEFMRNLVQYGFNSSGKETMIDGITGEILQDPSGNRKAARIFTGPCYYQALRHHVLDKIQARARGAVKQTSRQPVSGRANRGGQRFGEMERDALISHGASAFLRERLCISSDAYKTILCKTCGTIAIADHLSNKYECRKCGDDAQFGTCVIPYAYKLLMHLLAGAGFNMTHQVSNQKDKFGQLKK